MDCVLQASSLSKCYKHCQALDSLTMSVPKGAIYGLVGKNGAGKTTLLRLICGLQEPTSGNFQLYGISNESRCITKARRRMGAVVEAPAFYAGMTAKENLIHQYRVLGLPTCEGIPELLRTVGLEHTGKRKARDFSLGMKQRLGIALALAGDPDFLVLDEPTNGLDPQGIVEMRELILQLNRERQITVLVSSHILDELSRLATHYGIIDAGRMVKELSARELDQACHKRTRVETTNVTALACLLDSLQLEYRVASEHEVYVLSEVAVGELVAEAARRNCEIISVREESESLEGYYLSLISADEVGGAGMETDKANVAGIGADDCV